MNKILATAFLAAMIAFAPAEAAKLTSVVNVAIPDRNDGLGFTLDEIRALIMQGCTKREWKPKLEADTVLTCEILVRGRHYVKVEIPFSEDAYSILYRDSEEMNYDEARQTIHRKYKGWVNNLQIMIDWQFWDAAEKPAGQPVVDKPSTSGSDSDRYEALLKLGELRDKGLISDKEFEAEKHKLLGNGQ